ncbi:MAG: hypothetical protein GF418_09160 [Chitinivibrionales bacterium]|nr:hypothetical protein [Chitinivibrionales bacterium]MBD3395776.1 hypothetical protein [Chitinivibrionales bacterium]
MTMRLVDMHYKAQYLLTNAALVLALTLPAAAELAFEPSARIQYTSMQLVNTSVASFERNYEPDTLLDLAWVHEISGEFAMCIRFSPAAFAYLGYWSSIHNMFVDGRSGGLLGKSGKHYSSGLTEAKAALSFGDGGSRQLVVTAGLFKYAYNDQARDLGEYLLASGTYPGVVYSGEDSIQLGGIHVQSTHPPNMTHNLFFTTELQVDPLFDFSAAYIGEIRLSKFFTFGAGVMLDRIIPVNPDNTSPPLHAIQDSATGRLDTLTFRGVKLMGRFAFDPKAFLDAKLFGPNDLILYGEAALLGARSYPRYYDDITERVPGMVGFNLPAFGLLDVLAVEGEYYGSRHANNPETQGAPYAKREPGYDDQDDYKWAVTAVRGVGEHVSLRLRAASDHLREGGHSRQRTVAPDEWYWSIRLTATF